MGDSGSSPPPPPPQKKKNPKKKTANKKKIQKNPTNSILKLFNSLYNRHDKCTKINAKSSDVIGYGSPFFTLLTCKLSHVYNKT